jgi:hypothetical protein
VALKFATLAKCGTELSRGGKNKRRVALICHLFGIDMPCGGSEKLPPLQKVAYKFKRWQLYCIYDIITTITFLQELQKKTHNDSCAVTLTPSEL